MSRPTLAAARAHLAAVVARVIAVKGAEHFGRWVTIDGQPIYIEKSHGGGEDYHKFGNKAESAKWLKETAGVNPKVTARQTESLVDYGVTDNRDINAALRAGDASDRRVADIDEAIGRSRLPMGVVAYRGIPEDVIGADDATGATITDLGFVSSSLDHSLGEWFAKGADEGGRGVLLEMHLPKGSPALSMEVFSGMGEGELLLPRGTDYQVVKEYVNDTGRRVVVVEPTR
jgi:hypothetical protein